MTESKQKKHDAQIVSQFTKQAIPFAELPGHLDSIQILIKMSNVTSDDLVLDVACGPGLVACEFAKVAQHVSGIDLTEKMIEQAKSRQNEMALANLSWDVGTVSPLPYDNASFSVVVTRYSFHHFLDPKAVLMEMIRVCKPDGIVLIADAALPADKVDAYNHMEKLRDPSHIKALSYEAWEQLLDGSGLKDFQYGSYRVPMELENQLKASFPNPGDDDKIRAIFMNDINTNALGVNAHWADNELHFSYPITIFAGRK